MTACHFPNRPRRSWTLLIPLLTLLAYPAEAQWTRQSPVPTYLDLRGIAAPTTERVFVATDDDSFDEHGALFESNDGGTSWVHLDIPFNLGDPLNGIFFLDSQLGWTFGNQNYRTTNGGTTWEELPFLGSTYRMEFFTPTFGYASSNGHWLSLDGGLTWELAPNNLFDFDFADSQVGIGVSESGIYRTTDGGTSFTLVQSGAAIAVEFLTATVAVAIVDDTFQRSTDGGVTWSMGAPADGRWNLLAVSTDVTLAWGRTGAYPDFDDRVFRSADGGQTWTDLGEVMDPGPFAASFAFAVPDPQSVVASDGAGSMFHSPDAGQTWNQAFQSRGSQQSFLSSASPVFPDAQTGYFGYGPGFVIKSTDGGASWTQISSGSGESLTDVDRFSNGDLIAVGENGILLTSSGTTPWIVHEAFTTDHLAAVQVIGPQEVVVVDETGRVFRSADAGSTWIAASSTPSSLEATDLHFTTLLDGWLTGFGFGEAALFHTNDGGDSWIPASGPLGAYNAVDFEGTNGWAANVSGRYYRTTDGGDTWLQGDLPVSPLQIQDMDFYDESLGYVVGWYGYAARSIDGGVTWTELPTPNDTDKFTDIYLIGPNEFWLSTHDDKAYYTATGGQNWAVLDIGSNGFGNFSAIAATPEGDAWTAGWQGYIEHFTGPPPPPLNRPPEASFDFVTVGLTVSFTDTSVDPDGFIVSWSWDFGDGETSTDQNPTHTFPEANTYIVELTVTDDDGDTGGWSRAVVVQAGPGGTFGDFTEVTPLDPLWVTPQDEDFWVVATAPADYDGDDDLDIAVLGFYVVYNESVEYMLVLMTNNGEATPEQWDFDYIDVPLGDLFAGSSDMAWGDPDGDGDQDLAVGTEGETVLYRNDDGLLVITDTELPGYYEDNFQADFDLRSISWADYDNDGDEDLLIPSVFDFEEYVFRTALMRNDGANGTGGWIFTEVSVGIDSTSHAQSAWADYDGDQDLDLLLINLAPLTDEGFVRRYRNDGGTFVGENILGPITIPHGEADWGDYDADGDLDILVVGSIEEEPGGPWVKGLRIYRNDADVFTPLEIIDCIPCEGWFDLTAGTWADYDSDGDVDILITGTYNSGSQIEGRGRIYKNEGGVFTSTEDDLPAPWPSGDRGGTFTWLDIDGEGDLDYFIAGNYWVPGGNNSVEAQMHLYRNDVTTSNANPTAPTGLTATVETPDQNATLSWNAATDDSTPASALTYDLTLRLNGEPVAVPRRLPQPGSVSAVTNWAITGLEDGEYIWTVRAVDSAFNGGPSAQGSFLVGTTTATGPDAVPRVYSFNSTYPNPFSGSTTLRYGLPESADVDVSVYDILGRLIVRIVQDEKPAGFHEVEWNASALASGVYLVRLSTESFTKTRQVMLVK